MARRPPPPLTPAAPAPCRAALNYTQVPLKLAHMVNRPLPASATHIRLTPALANDPT